MKNALTMGFERCKCGLRWAWGHKLRVALLALVLVILAPRQVKSQLLDPCCAILAAGLSTISSTLSNVIGGGLSSILTVDRAIQNFEQTVVWPLQQISQAQSLVGATQGTFNAIQGVARIPVNSATLPGPQQLEQVLLSADANQISRTSASYSAVYGPVPDVTAASQDVRNRIDMADAAAQAAMKRAIAIDNLANLEIQAANQINQSLQNAAPGSAPIIEAQADAWLVRANAYTQGAIADLMRVRAIDLADAGANIKSGATNTSNLGQQLINLLKRQ
jgi:hypothetical protein